MKKVASLVLVLLAAAALAACGSSSDTSSTSAETSAETTAETGGQSGGAEGASGGGKTSTLKIEAAQGTDLAFTSDSAETKAGKVELEFNNPQSIGHDVAIEDSSGKEVAETEVISSGTATASADLKPGTYTYFCTIPGHREAGMEGTLTVK